MNFSEDYTLIWHYKLLLSTNLFGGSIFFSFLVSAAYVSSAAAAVGEGSVSGGGRQRHAPLYGRFVVEEELPATHRDVMHHVSFYFVLSYVPVDCLLHAFLLFHFFIMCHCFLSIWLFSYFFFVLSIL